MQKVDFLATIALICLNLQQFWHKISFNLNFVGYNFCFVNFLLQRLEAAIKFDWLKAGFPSFLKLAYFF